MYTLHWGFSVPNMAPQFAHVVGYSAEEQVL
jgi:hypothetical protein